jgi:hypothetical protein
MHNVKVGATYQQTLLNENTHFGIVDPLLNAPCLDASGAPVAGFNDPSDCVGPNQPNIGSNPNATSPFLPFLGCYDLTRPTPSSADGCAGATSTLFPFLGHTDIKQLALFAQDTITKGPWSLNLGLRSDFYNGLTIHREAEPRVGVAYNVKKTNTVLRVSCGARAGTPFNENPGVSQQRVQFRGLVFALAVLGRAKSPILSWLAQ